MMDSKSKRETDVLGLGSRGCPKQWITLTALITGLVVAFVHFSFKVPITPGCTFAQPATQPNVLLAQHQTPPIQSHAFTGPHIQAQFPDGVRRVIPTGAFTDGWWKDTFPTWHQEVFALFSAYLQDRAYTTYLGFGEWVGPTAMFASTYVQRVFALEPDPAAHSMLAANVAANPDVAAKTHTSRMCIAAAPGTLKLRGAGGSGSFLEALVDTNGSSTYTSLHPTAFQEVTCIPLSAYMSEHKIDPSSAFIKVDTEGAEWHIVPSLHSWLASMDQGKRPTFVISMHPNSDDIIDKAAPMIVQVAHLFKYAGTLPPLTADGEPYATGVASVGNMSRFRTTSDVIKEAHIRRCADLMCDIVLSDFTGT